MRVGFVKDLFGFSELVLFSRDAFCILSIPGGRGDDNHDANE